MDENEQLAQASDMIRQQQRLHRSDGEPKPISKALADSMQRILARVDALPVATPEAAARAKAVDDARAAAERKAAWQKLAARLGRRYENATLSGYRAETEAQKTVLGEVRDYVKNIAANLNNGRSVMLFGPPGTGKDHLATAIMRAAILSIGAKVEWIDGADFYGSIRDAIGLGSPESAVLAKWRSPDLLCVSDPMPPLGKVESAYQLSMLHRVIDRRYRDCKATMMTMNVEKRKEAEERLSPNLVDRLGHGALVLCCDWPSFRK